jgi:colanic acid/amylovoran biosynthesis glycosyltransferase
MPSAAAPRTVVVFRKRLLPYSETFIAAQGHALRRFRPVFVGFHQDKNGLHHLRREECEWLSPQRWRAELARLPMRFGAAAPAGWTERIRAHRPVLIHAHFGADGHDALPLARALGVPLVASVHGHDVIGRLKPAQSRKLAVLFKEARAIIAPSRLLQGCAVQAGCPADKIVQHYIGIDLSQFTAARQESPPTILFVGRLVKSKGCAEAIAATVSLQSEFPDLRLVVVGDGPLRKQLEIQASQNLKNWTFTGAIPPAQVRQLMQQAWLFCAPRITLPNGYAEALGMVFLEAQACGLPVVAYDNGGIAETVVHEKTGLLAKEGDLNALTEHMRRVLSNPPFRAVLSSNASQHVQAHFDLARQTRILEDLYEQWTAAGSTVAA